MIDTSDVGYKISAATDRGDLLEYKISRADLEFPTSLQLFVAKDLDQNVEFWEKISDKIKLLLYHQVGLHRDWHFQTTEQSAKFLNDLLPKFAPEEKLYTLLGYFHSLANYHGEFVEIDLHTSHVNNVWRKMFFASIPELEFYIDSLKTKEWVQVYYDGGPFIRVQLTMSGLTQISSYLESKNSNTCFVAMSFDAALMEIYTNAIQPAIIETGFVPFILHSESIATGQTINDAMIAAIKKARFTIADFTQHKDGVYFEAGFALGRGQKVIFTCKESDIGNAHFDTRNYQHILWKDAADLKRKLVNKIEAYIKD